MSKEAESPHNDQIIESGPAETPVDAVTIEDTLGEMEAIYRADPMAAVRGQRFIKVLHKFLGSQLDARLTEFARKRGIQVVYEGKILGSTKPKDVDVAVIDPTNGPLVLVGVRSQMSSIGNNVLTYYEGIVGECISLQDRFPMSTHGYVYLHPLKSIKEGKEKEIISHGRYAELYADVTGRLPRWYKGQRGLFDEFAYMVVDFDSAPVVLRDDIVQAAVTDLDMSVTSFVDRIIETFNSRMLFWDIFTDNR